MSVVPFRLNDATPGDRVYFVEDVDRKIPMLFKGAGHFGSVVVTFERPTDVGRRDAILRQKQIVREVSE